MAKFDFKKMFLAKGEKIVLGGAIVGLGLLGVMGVMNAFSADSPTETVSKLKSGASSINNQIGNKTGTVAPLPQIFSEPNSFTPLDTNAFVVHNHPFFEPVDFPSTLRENPKVKAITAAQLDLVRAPMIAYDIKPMQGGGRAIGVLSKVKLSATDQKTVSDLLKKQGNPGRQRPGMQAPGGLQGQGQGQQAPPPGMQGQGQGGRPGAGGPPPGMGGPGGSGDGGYGLPGGGFAQQGERYEMTVSYIPVDDFDKQPNRIPAFTVYPIRMVVVHASFPLREQLEEIKRALRLKTLDQARQESIPGKTTGGVGVPGGGVAPGGPGTEDGAPGAGGGAMSLSASSGPVFDGFEVERKITAPNGQTFDWAKYDHVGEYVDKIWSRKISDQPDDGHLSYFLRYDQMMAMPLPKLAEGLVVYPKIRLPAIVAAVKKMEEQRKPKITPSDQQNKIKGITGGSNPFMPQGGLQGAGGAGGVLGGLLGSDDAGPGIGMPAMPGGGGGRGGGYGGGQQGPPPGGQMPPGGGGGRGGGYGGGQQGPPPGYGGAQMPPPGYGGQPPGYGNPPTQTDTPEKDHMLIRFFDADIQPGYTYQYRVRVKMKNPNYLRKDVGRPDDAQQEVVTGDWMPILDKVTVSSELNMYAADPVEYPKKVREKYRDQAVVNLLDNRNGSDPVVQIQAWMEQVWIESKREPVGTWVVGEVPVHRGEYIGKKQVVSLPMWSSEKGTYILQEMPRYKVWKAKEQPKGVLVDFTTRHMLVDYEGGKTRQQIADRGLDDESVTELLILRPDGTITVRSSGDDLSEEDRKDRQTIWEDWINAVKKKTEQVGQPTMPGGGDPGFGRPGGGGGTGTGS